MGIATTIIGLAIMAYGAYTANEARKDQKEANKDASTQRKAIQGENNALNAQKQAQERRALIREERVRRGKIMQSAENTGVSGGSGVEGATGALSTQLSSNLGANLGMAAAGQRIGEYAQNAADFDLASQNAALKAQQGEALVSMGSRIAGS
jgi:hypothetical protein